MTVCGTPQDTESGETHCLLALPASCLHHTVSLLMLSPVHAALLQKLEQDIRTLPGVIGVLQHPNSQCVHLPNPGMFA